MDSKQLALLCRKIAEDKKAENIVVLDVRKLSTVTDFFVVMSATSEPHLRALAAAIAEKVEEESGLRPRAVDGTLRASWMIMDYVDAMVHIMRADSRSHYDLEGLWGDAPRLKARKPRLRKSTRKTP
ncbi:MAG: ribosome silencing factor [Verrucomicrobia bacterium]|nr:ribosome silencing factor [Verrucomicrobiota bacterium]